MNEKLPEWAALIEADSSRWTWQNGKLLANSRSATKYPAIATSRLRAFFLDKIYADHNSSKNVRKTIRKTIRELESRPDAWGLNFGSGSTRFSDQILNLDIFESETTDIVSDGGKLPFYEGSIALVISQEVLEHVSDYMSAINDIHRVLRCGGHFYAQVPFQIGYHSGPKDYRRFTHDGLRHIFDNEKWSLEEIGISTGHGTGFYRIAVEYFAVTASVVSQRLYLPTKILFAVFLYPFKFADLITKFSSEWHRIPGGYYIVARKR